jgi:hypothetical protein
MGKPFGIAVFTAFAGGLGVGLNAMLMWGVYWTRAAPASRRRQAAERRGSRLRDLRDRDRWGWWARPDPSALRVKIARSASRTLAGSIGVLSMVALLVLFGLIWAEFNDQITRAELVGALWAPLFAVVLAGVAVQTLRLVLVRPRLWVNYQTPSLMAKIGRGAVNLVARLGRVEAATADEPWRSTWTPAAMAGLVTARGFTVEDDVDLLDVARRLDSPTAHSRSVRNGRVAVARFAGR